MIDREARWRNAVTKMLEAMFKLQPMVKAEIDSMVHRPDEDLTQLGRDVRDSYREIQKLLSGDP